MEIPHGRRWLSRDCLFRGLRADVTSAAETHRQRLRQEADCSFIEPEEFICLVISNQRLQRADKPMALVRGLFDPVTGRRFLLEEERLKEAR